MAHQCDELLADVQAQKVHRIAEAMRADRDKAFSDYLHTPADEVPRVAAPRGQILLLLTKERRKEWGL